MNELKSFVSLQRKHLARHNRLQSFMMNAIIFSLRKEERGSMSFQRRFDAVARAGTIYNPSSFPQIFFLAVFQHHLFPPHRILFSPLPSRPSRVVDLCNAGPGDYEWSDRGRV